MKILSLILIWGLGYSAFFYGVTEYMSSELGELGPLILFFGSILILYNAWRNIWFWSITKPLMMFKIRKIPCPNCKSINKTYLGNRVDIRSSSRGAGQSENYNTIDHHGTRWIKVLCSNCQHNWEEGISFKSFSLAKN